MTYNQHLRKLKAKGKKLKAKNFHSVEFIFPLDFAQKNVIIWHAQSTDLQVRSVGFRIASYLATPDVEIPL